MNLQPIKIQPWKCRPVIESQFRKVWALFSFCAFIMNKLPAILQNSRRFYNLRFHKHDVISTGWLSKFHKYVYFLIETKVFWMAISLAVFPACYWAYGFMNRARERRLEREAKYGAPFFKPFPRDIRVMSYISLNFIFTASSLGWWSDTLFPANEKILGIWRSQGWISSWVSTIQGFLFNLPNYH